MIHQGIVLIAVFWLASGVFATTTNYANLQYVGLCEFAHASNLMTLSPSWDEGCNNMNATAVLSGSSSATLPDPCIWTGVLCNNDNSGIFMQYSKKNIEKIFCDQW